tara:strand:+ start:311 stop:517 length:207 start_codon:yes stop_codon:yes gene_type:complete
MKSTIKNHLFVVMCLHTLARRWGVWKTDDGMMFFSEEEAHREAALARVKEQGHIISVHPAEESKDITS